jgi:hypothetical protein
MMSYPDRKPHTPESVGLNSGEVDRMDGRLEPNMRTSRLDQKRCTDRPALGRSDSKNLCFKYDSLQFIVFLVG